MRTRRTSRNRSSGPTRSGNWPTRQAGSRRPAGTASVVSQKFVCIRPAMHPAWLRCSSVAYSRYSPSSRLAIRAPRRPRCDNELLRRDTGSVRLVWSGRWAGEPGRAGRRVGRSAPVRLMGQSAWVQIRTRLTCPTCPTCPTCLSCAILTPRFSPPSTIRAPSEPADRRS